MKLAISSWTVFIIADVVQWATDISLVDVNVQWVAFS
jgi:hypothetical protein